MLVGSLILAINFAPVPDESALVLGLAGFAFAALVAFYHSAAPGGEPAVRPAGRAPPPLLGRGVRRHHRVRLADGGDVRQPAVPPERARVLDARGRCRDPPCGARDGRRRAALGEAGRGPRCPVHAALPATCSCSLAFLWMLLVWNEGAPYWQIGLAYVFIGAGVGLAGTPASHSLTGSVPVTARRHGVRNGRSPARPRRRDHAVDLRRVPDGRVRVGDHRPRSRASGNGR